MACEDRFIIQGHDGDRSKKKKRQRKLSGSPLIHLERLLSRGKTEVII